MSQKGFSTTVSLTLILVLLIVAIVVFIAAKSISLGQIKIPQIAQKTQESALNCKFNDDNFCDFYKKLEDSSSYYKGGLRLTVDSKSAKGVLTKSIWEADSSNSGRFVFYSDGKKASETVMVDKNVYTLDVATGKWEKQSFTSFSTDINSDIDIVDIKKFVVTKIIDKLSIAKVSFIDQEVCGHKECFKYQVKLPGLSNTKEYVYFGNKNFLLFGTKSNAKDGFWENSHLETSDIKITTPSL